jgi:hypothetical protein
MKPTMLVVLITPALVALAVLAPAQQDPRAAIFVQHGCQECHAISPLGVKAATDVGPDLTFAYVDVVNRFGMNLRSFFKNPPGLMGFVLSSHIHLTQADQDSITRILYEICQEHLAEMDEEMPSFPPSRARPRTRSGSVPHASCRED